LSFAVQNFGVVSEIQKENKQKRNSKRSFESLQRNCFVTCVDKTILDKKFFCFRLKKEKQNFEEIPALPEELDTKVKFSKQGSKIFLT
jgi:hypothetical protein